MQERIYRNLPTPALVELAVRQGEGMLSHTGALVVSTGPYTGRSPEDRFLVDTPDIHGEIAWGNVNRPISREAFQSLWRQARAYLQGRESFVMEGYAGRDPRHRRSFRLIQELASQALLTRNLLIPEPMEETDYTVLVVPGFSCDPEGDGVHSEAAILLDLSAHQILICGTRYGGEIKKAIFSTMNYVLTKENVLPMHCAANLDSETGETAIFFGLSGTGKTTLSADPDRLLIGDDEHGWSEDGIFNLEGGCYAKCIHLDPRKEPEIFKAIRFGAVAENVVLDPETRIPDYDDQRYTENTRAAYPISHISRAVSDGRGGIPKVIFFLTADAFGVLPPISRLTPEGAMYHFLTGFTSKLSGTEQGITAPVPTFSALFGEPFMPRDPLIYAQMLGDRIRRHKTAVYLLNTGWIGGPATQGGHRIALSHTRAMVTAALNGTLPQAAYTHSALWNVEIPQEIPGVPSILLAPQSFWNSQGRTDYLSTAQHLAELFQKNFHSKYPHMPDAILNAGPRE